MKRLSTVDPMLTRRLLSASPGKRRKAVHIACALAIKSATIEHPLLDKAMQAIESGVEFDSDQYSQLELLVEQLDYDYFKLDENSPKSPESDAAVMCLFRQARAAAAVLYGTQWVIPDEAAESVYEASLTFDEPTEVTRVLHEALD